MPRRTSLRLQSQASPQADSQQTTRTNSSRNRLGCHTCRIRRKKCDERKDPSKGGSCDTCLRLNIECLGWGPSRPAWCSNEGQLHAFKESIKRKIAMRRGGLDMYNDQCSEDFLCDISSGSSNAVDSDHCQLPNLYLKIPTDIQTAPNLSFSPSPNVLVPIPLPDFDIGAVVHDAQQTQYFAAVACELATSTGVSPPLLDSLRQLADLAHWKANQMSAAVLDATEFQQRVQVISDQIQNSIPSVPFDVHGHGYADISSSLFEINRTACILLLDGICTGLGSSSPVLAEGVKEVQTQVNAISFLPNVPPQQYLFATCIAKSFAADIDMSFMNTLLAPINDPSIETTAQLLLAMAHCRNAVW